MTSAIAPTQSIPSAVRPTDAVESAATASGRPAATIGLAPRSAMQPAIRVPGAEGIAPSVSAPVSWHYTLGQARENQQATFCPDAETALRVAALFERQTIRAAYEAVSSQCRVAVATFTPQQIVKQVAVQTLDGSYTASFVTARTADGQERVLFTTRKVVDPSRP